MYSMEPRRRHRRPARPDCSSEFQYLLGRAHWLCLHGRYQRRQVRTHIHITLQYNGSGTLRYDSVAEFNEKYVSPAMLAKLDKNPDYVRSKRTGGTATYDEPGTCVQSTGSKRKLHLNSVTGEPGAKNCESGRQQHTTYESGRQQHKEQVNQILIALV